MLHALPRRRPLAAILALLSAAPLLAQKPRPPALEKEQKAKISELAARWWKGSVGASLLDYAPCSILIARGH